MCSVTHCSYRDLSLRLLNCHVLEDHNCRSVRYLHGQLISCLHCIALYTSPLNFILIRLLSQPFTPLQVIELKRDANAAVVLNNLWKMTSLQTSFSGNFLALRQGGTSPGRFTLREALDEFLDFRFETVRKLDKRSSQILALFPMPVSVPHLVDSTLLRCFACNAFITCSFLCSSPLCLSNHRALATLGASPGRLSSRRSGSSGSLGRRSLARHWPGGRSDCGHSGGAEPGCC